MKLLSILPGSAVIRYTPFTFSELIRNAEPGSGESGDPEKYPSPTPAPSTMSWCLRLRTKCTKIIPTLLNYFSITPRITACIVERRVAGRRGKQFDRPFKV